MFQNIMIRKVCSLNIYISILFRQRNVLLTILKAFYCTVHLLKCRNFPWLNRTFSQPSKINYVSGWMIIGSYTLSSTDNPLKENICLFICQKAERKWKVFLRCWCDRDLMLNYWCGCVCRKIVQIWFVIIDAVWGPCCHIGIDGVPYGPVLFSSVCDLEPCCPPMMGTN